MSAAIAKQNEPTMDEILASIRKIISDDLGEASPSAAAAQVSLKPEVSADVLELSSEMALPVAKDPAWKMQVGRREDVDVSEKSRASVSTAPTDPVSAVTELAARMAILSSQADKAPLDTAPVAASTENAVSSAFGSLRQTIERESSADAAISSAMRTVVEAALRPMLKDWLDSNLPSIVERLVKAEIERMAKKG
jgi:hypothetical protein